MLIHKSTRGVFAALLMVVLQIGLFGGSEFALAQAPSFSVDTSSAATPAPLTGLWWNAGESGWGVSMTQQADKLFAAMYVYDANGNAVWYTVSCVISAAGCNGDLNKNRGGATPTAPWSGSSISVVKVGSMNFQFSSNDAGTMSYTLDGMGNTKAITRFIFGPQPPAIPGLAGTWFGSIIETRSNCISSQNNGGHATYGQYDINTGTGLSGAINIALAGVTGLQCSYNGNFTTNGARLAASGTLSCIDGKRGTWQSNNIAITAKSMTLELAVQLNTTETCSIAAILGGLRP